MTNKTMDAILCVDDEAGMVNSLYHLLSDSFDVIVTTSSVQAIQIFGDNDNIKMIISDHRMPEMNGIQMLAKIKALNPNRIYYSILYSGYTDAMAQMDENVKAGLLQQFLSKTISPLELIRHVNVGMEWIRHNGDKPQLHTPLVAQ